MTAYDPHTMPPPPAPGYLLYSEVLDQAREIEREDPELAVSMGTCPGCGHMKFYYPGLHAVNEGHVYSEAGVAEAETGTKLCEYCYDIVAQPDGAIFVPVGENLLDLVHTALRLRRTAFGSERA